jgi:hypothetical protein
MLAKTATIAMQSIMSRSFLLRLLILLTCSMSFTVCTYHAHRVVSSEYFRSCNANMFVAIFIKNSRYCEVMRWMILLMETKFTEVARLFVTSLIA